MNGRSGRASTWAALALAVGGAGCQQVVEDFLDRHGHGDHPDGGTSVPEQPPALTTLPAGSVCIRDGWCYEHPRPHGLDQGSVWASSAHDVWAAAKYEPVLLHADAERWTVVDVPVPGSMVTVIRGGRPEEPWVLSTLPETGGTAVFRREGGSWVEKKRWVAALVDFYVAPNGDAWVPAAVYNAMNVDGRYDSTVERFDAATQAWTTIGTFPETLIYTVWASAPDDAWAAGREAAAFGDARGGVAYHFDGATWTRVPAPFERLVQRIRGSGPDDVWLAGTGNGGGSSLARLVGDAWEVVLTRPMAFNANELEVPAPGDVWVAFDGVFHATDASAGAAATWNRIDAPVTTFDVASTGAVAMAGDRGELWFAGRESEAPRRLTLGPRQSTGRVWGTSSASVWVVGVDDAGAGALLHVAPAGTTQTSLPAGSEKARAIWAASDQDIWIVGSGGLIVHGNGLTGTFAALPAPSTDDLSGLWGSGPDNVWIAGGHTLLRWNGTAFESPDYGGFNVMDVAGTASDDVWVVGEKVAHLRGGVWTVGTVPSAVEPPGDTTAFASAVWANGLDEVFIGTEQNNSQLVWRGYGYTDATSWALLAGATHGYVNDLFGARDGDLWSTGPYIEFHWDGSEVSFTDVLLDNWDARYWGTSPENMWASTSGGVLHRRRE